MARILHTALVSALVFSSATLAKSSAAEPKHPRLFFSPDDLAKLKAKSTDDDPGALRVSAKSLFDAIHQRAQAYQANPIKPSDEEYGLRKLRERFYDMALAYAVRCDLEMQIALLRDVSTMCSLRSWGDLSGGFGMVSAGAGVAFAYDVLYPVLDETEEASLDQYLKKHRLYERRVRAAKKEEDVFAEPDTDEDGDDADPVNIAIPKALEAEAAPPQWKVAGRRAIRHAIARYAASPLYNSAKSGGFQGLSNIYLCQLSALGLMGLALSGEADCPDASKWVEAAETGLRRNLDLSDADGGWPEGLGYGSLAFRQLIMFADALKRMTGRNLMTHPALRNVAHFAMHTTSPDANYGVGFCDTWGHPGFGLCTLRLAREFADPYAMWHLRRIRYPRAGEGIHPFLFHHSEVAPKSPEGARPRGRHFRRVGWVTLRAAWEDPDALFFAMKSGPDGYHTQNDQNHFELYAYQAYLSTDHGYTHRRAWRGGTVGHNSLLIDGQGQCCGWVRGRSGKILEFLCTPAFSYVKANANSYGTRERLLDWFYRRVHFTSPDYVVVFDDVASRNDVPRRATFLLQITREHSRPQSGEIEIGDNEVYLVPAGSRSYLRAAFLHPADCKFERRMYYDRGYDELTGPYLAATTPEKAPRSRLVVVLLPQRARADGKPSSQVEVGSLDAEGGAAISVRGPQYEDLHLFRFGDEGEVAGSGLVCRGSTALLSRDPEGRMTRFALCEGVRLAHHEQLLIASSSPVVAAFSTWRDYQIIDGVRTIQVEADRMYGGLSLRTGSRVQFHCPAEPTRLVVDGEVAPSITFDSDRNLCTLALSAGDHRVELWLKRESRE